MLRHFFTSCFAFSLIAPSLADSQVWSQARELIDKQQSSEAIHLLSDLENSPEKNFWMGRALIEQGRCKAAADYLSQVPEESSLYVAAAKALIYCAWSSHELDFAQVLEKLRQSTQPDIAQFAQAAMLENQLYHDQLPDRVQAQLDELIQGDRLGKIRKAAPLLEIDILRLQGKYKEALQLGRELENNTDLPNTTRHRAKILLAQIYYSLGEQIESYQTQIPNLSQTEEDADKHAEDWRGQGEETLIQFISANPDSPVLPDFFHELYRRNAFEQSSYLRPALESWTEPAELIHTKRAAIALRCLYYLDSKDQRVSNSLINTALASCPRENSSQDLLLSTIRDALNKGQLAQAEQYLKLVSNHDCYAQFLEAQLLALKGYYASALPLFTKCSEESEGSLHDAALCNAFICALNMNDHALAIKLLDQASSDENKAHMLSNRAAFYMQSRPAQSRADAQLICNEYASTSYFINAQLDLIQLVLPDSLAQAIDRLRRIDTSDSTSWNSDVLSRYYAMRIQLAIEAQKNHLEGTLSPIQVIEQALKSCQVPEVRPHLVFQYSYYLALEERFEDAAKALFSFAYETKVPELRAQALLRSGIAEEQLNSTPSLKRAIQRYKECGEILSPQQTMSLLRAASLLTRLGKGDEARATLNKLEQRQAELSATEQCLLLSELADSWACTAPDDKNSQDKALDYCEQMTRLPHLPQAWQNRAHLQHAILAARFGQGELAIEHYTSILENIQGVGRITLRGDWYIANSAATGAIIELTNLKRFDEAMQIAETMSQKIGNPLASLFTQWASYIRKAEKILG